MYPALATINMLLDVLLKTGDTAMLLCILHHLNKFLENSLLFLELNS